MDTSTAIGLDPALLQSLAQSDPSRVTARTSATGRNSQTAAINAAAEEFEAVFISQMMQPMWAGVEVDDTFGGGHGEDMFRGFLTQEYGKIAAKSGGLGLADHVRAELLRIQEKEGQS